MAGDHIAVCARITGRVQGVFYRGWTQSRAKELGLGGWVRNEDDGSVSALFAGPRAAIDEMVEALWQGPSGALVDNVVLETAETGQLPTRFDILR